MIPKIQTMETPKTRAEFELRFHYLLEHIKSGKRMPRELGESLLRLKKLPNGRLNFLSVDEMARLNANTIFQFSGLKKTLLDREEQSSFSEK